MMMTRPTGRVLSKPSTGGRRPCAGGCGTRDRPLEPAAKTIGRLRRLGLAPNATPHAGTCINNNNYFKNNQSVPSEKFINICAVGEKKTKHVQTGSNRTEFQLFLTRKAISVIMITYVDTGLTGGAATADDDDAADGAEVVEPGEAATATAAASAADEVIVVAVEAAAAANPSP